MIIVNFLMLNLFFALSPHLNRNVRAHDRTEPAAVASVRTRRRRRIIAHCIKILAKDYQPFGACGYAKAAALA